MTLNVIFHRRPILQFYALLCVRLVNYSYEKLQKWVNVEVKGWSHIFKGFYLDAFCP